MKRLLISFLSVALIVYSFLLQPLSTVKAAEVDPAVISDPDAIDLRFTNTLGLFRNANGSVWAWGTGSRGDGITNARYAPTLIIPSGVKSLATAPSSAPVVVSKSDGSVWAWGPNPNGLFTDKSVSSTNTPTLMPDLTDVKEVYLAQSTIYALKNDGTLWARGAYTGDPSYVLGSPAVKAMDDVKKVYTSGTATYVLKNDGSLWSWGSNSAGYVGNGTTTVVTTPFQVLTDVEDVSPDQQSVFVRKTDGSYWSWGYNYYGQLGNGTTTNRTSPAKFTGVINIVKLYHKENRTFAINNIGAVYSWGYGSSGALGDGAIASKSTPAAVPLLNGVTDIYLSTVNGAARKPDGSFVGWGLRVGNGATAGTSSSPKAVTSTGLTGIERFFGTPSSDYFAFMKSDGTLWAFGVSNNALGGRGFASQTESPNQIENIRVSADPEPKIIFGDLSVSRDSWVLFEGRIWNLVGDNYIVTKDNLTNIPYDSAINSGAIFEPTSVSNVGYWLNTLFYGNISNSGKSFIEKTMWSLSSPNGTQYQKVSANVGLLSSQDALNYMELQHVGTDMVFMNATGGSGILVWQGTNGFFNASVFGSGSTMANFGIRPALHLKPTITVASGSGSYDDPYVISSSIDDLGSDGSGGGSDGGGTGGTGGTGSTGGTGGTVIIGQPTGLTLISKSSDSVRFGWNGVNGATKYKVYRDDNLMYTGTSTIFSDTGIAPNTTYIYTVSAIDANGESSKALLPVTTDSSGTPITDISVGVTGLVAQINSPNSATISWNPVSNASFYTVKRNSLTVYTGTSLFYTDSGLAPNSDITYTVTAQSGSQVSPAATANVTTPALLSKPANLTATVAPDGSSVTLLWDAVTDALSYQVQKSEVTVSNNSQLSYVDSDVSVGDTVTYIVTAFGEDTYSSGAKATVTVAVNTPPGGSTDPLDVPTNLIATDITKSSASLTWNPVTNATSYDVFRNDVLINNVTSTSFVDTGLTPKTAYTYKVVAKNSTSQSSAALLVATTKSALSVPTGFTTSSVKDTTADLHWDVVSGATGYKVYRGATLVYDGSSNAFTDTGLTPNTPYVYTVKSYNADDESSTVQLSFTTMQLIIPMPTGFSVTSATYDKLYLEWNPSDNALGYKILSNGSEVYSGNDLKFRLDGLTADTVYNLTLYAVNGSSLSSPSTLTAKTAKMPIEGAPVIDPLNSGFQATDKTDTSVSMKWNAINDATSYSLYRDNSLVGTVSGSTYAYIDTNLSPGHTYNYSLVANNDKGSSNSVGFTVTTELLPPAAPQNLKAVRVYSDGASMQWSPVEGVTTYKVYRDDTALVYEGSLNSFRDITAAPSTTYSYQVFAVNAGGQTGSSVVSVTTAPEALPMTVSPAPNPQAGTISFTFRLIDGVSEYTVTPSLVP